MSSSPEAPVVSSTAAVPPDPEMTYTDCFESFKEAVSTLPTWESRRHSSVSMLRFVSVSELFDGNTDIMCGWEKHTTVKGLKIRGAVPNPATLTEDQILDLMDNLQAREFCSLDGMRVVHTPVSCVYLFDIDGLAGEHTEFCLFLKSLLCYLSLLGTLSSQSNTLENEEFMFHCHEVHGLSGNIVAADLVASLKEAAAACKSPAIQKRLEMRAAMLTIAITMLASHQQSKEAIDASIASAAGIASGLRGLCGGEGGRTPGTVDPAAFPPGTHFWVTTSVAVSNPQAVDVPDLLEKMATFYDSVAGFERFAACKNIFDIIAVAEKIAVAAPCVSTRVFASRYVFRDPASSGVAMGRSILFRGDNLLGGNGLKYRVVKHLEEEYGAPLYFSLLNPTSTPQCASNLNDVVHYIVACNNGHSGARVNDGQMEYMKRQVQQTLFRWVDEASLVVADVIQSALYNTGRQQRRTANTLSAIGSLQALALELDQGVFCALRPTGTNATREASLRAGVLSAFTKELATDAMERFVRATMRLGLPTNAELVACSWYLDLILTTRVEQISTVQLRSADRASVPERRVNRRTGTPLDAPALTSRVASAFNMVQLGRADVARLVADASFMSSALLQSFGVLPSQENPAALVSTATMFDHRFIYCQRIRIPAMPPFEACAARVKQFRQHSLFMLMSGCINVATETSETAKRLSREAAAAKSPFLDEITALEKSIRALIVNMSLVRSLLFDAAAISSFLKPGFKEPANPTEEEIAAKLSGYDVALDAPFDKSLVIPTLKKRA